MPPVEPLVLAGVVALQSNAVFARQSGVDVQWIPVGRPNLVVTRVAVPFAGRVLERHVDPSSLCRVAAVAGLRDC